MTLRMNRREAMALGVGSMAALPLLAGADDAAVPAIVASHDEGLQRSLNAQVTDPKHPSCGAIPDQWTLYHARHAARFLRDSAAAYFHPQSRFHASQELFGRMQLAAGFLDRIQKDSGNIDLLSTNFDSPPDTGFVVHELASAAKLAQMQEDTSVLALMEPFLRRAGQGMAKGGIHTPNHRWVVSAALAQIHNLFPNPRYVTRIDQWLAEGIDIDAEGQFTERSTATYNTVVDRSFILMAHKLKRPDLLAPVRQNLDAMAYLLHPNGEVVTEISNRQDANTRGTMAGYWFALRYMAIHDGNGLYATMLQPLEPGQIELATWMEYPELQQALPAPTPVPDTYELELPLSGITRIRRKQTSATLIHRGNSRWFSLHQGAAVINAVRFASAFFGKGQFVPGRFERREDGFYFSQKLQGQYYQPLTDPSLLPVSQRGFGVKKSRRETSEICRMVYEGFIRETAQGFEIDIRAEETDNVPLAVEINLREGGTLSGVRPAPHVKDAFLLEDGWAEYRMGTDVIRIGPGHCEHGYVQVRGAHAKLTGPSIYLTGYTPFHHTLELHLR